MNREWGFRHLGEASISCIAADITCDSDEVYANSVFSSTDFPSPPQFTSVLALDVKKHINPTLVHCLYGMSKVREAARALCTLCSRNVLLLNRGSQDFCSNGIRLGAFISQSNPELHAAIRAVS